MSRDVGNGVDLFDAEPADGPREGGRGSLGMSPSLGHAGCLQHGEQCCLSLCSHQDRFSWSLWSLSGILITMCGVTEGLIDWDFLGVPVLVSWTC